MGARRTLGRRLATGAGRRDTHRLNAYVMLRFMSSLLRRLPPPRRSAPRGRRARDLRLGSDDDSGGDLLVSAATSLKTAFTSYGEQFDAADAQFSFAGSDELAAQIRSGAKPDVFASRTRSCPTRCSPTGSSRSRRSSPPTGSCSPSPPTTRRWPASTTSGKRGVTIAIGAEGVPVGAYTRKVLGRLDAAQRKAILANVRSKEPDVGGIRPSSGRAPSTPAFSTSPTSSRRTAA